MPVSRRWAGRWLKPFSGNGVKSTRSLKEPFSYSHILAPLESGAASLRVCSAYLAVPVYLCSTNLPSGPYAVGGYQRSLFVTCQVIVVNIVQVRAD